MDQALAGLLINLTRSGLRIPIKTTLIIEEAQRLARSETTPAPSQGLRPPFALLKGKDIPNQYVPAKELRLQKEVIFPQTAPPSEQEYAKLWQDFIKEANALPDKEDPLSNIESLLDLMKRYLWCFAGDQEDVSLYDQCRVTAAIAACLGDDAQAEEVGYLVAGNISGIQRFIYQVLSKGATRQLRARSLYLQLLTEAAARYILREFGLPVTNLIYAGGGNFYLLLPKAYASREADLRRYLDEMLLRHHDGDLYISLAGVPMKKEHFSNHASYAKQWEKLRRELTKDKYRRFAAHSDLASIFDPRNEYDDDREEFRKRMAEREQQADTPTDELEDEDDAHNSRLYQSLRRISDQTRRMTWLVLAEVKPPDFDKNKAGTVQDALEMLGMSVFFVDETGTVQYGNKKDEPVKPISAERLIALRIHDGATQDVRDILKEADYSCPIAVATRYMSNETPEKRLRAGDQRPKFATFSELQRASKGIPRLGVLRMDVDNLGSLFGSGFIRENVSRATLARSAGLSFNMSLFFEGWVSELCRTQNEQRLVTRSDEDTEKDGKAQEIEVQPLYAVYSGGDDLFIVGAWHCLPDLAKRIHDDFRDFGCKNNCATISAGITLHRGKHPLYQAAEEAARALDSAKGIKDKNAVAFLGEAISWERWDKVEGLHNTILEIIGTGGDGKRSLLQILLSIHTLYTDLRTAADKEAKQKGKAKPQFVWGPWMWRSAYQLTRFAERYPDFKNQVKTLQDNLSEDKDFKGIEIVGLAARWAEAATRTKRGV